MLMNKLFILGRKFILPLFLYTASASAQSISGKVLDEMTAKPLVGVKVRLSGTSIEELTNSEGNFNLSGDLISGEQIIVFSKSSFLERRYPIIINSDGLELGIIYLKPDLLEVQQQMAVITLADQELDEEDAGSSNVSGLLRASRDIFLNAAAFDFSPAFFRPRGYDSEWGKVLINGIEMNKFFSGRPVWSNWGGLNDVQRNQVFTMGLSASDVSFGGLAGTTNIIMRASQYGEGGKVSYAVANRAYTGRIMGSYHTGLSEAGWAFSVSMARRYAEESFVQGSLYDANSFFASVEKVINDKHSINFTGLYTPNRRGKNSPNTQEVYDLRGNDYNSYWGLQDGEIRNSRIKEVNEPILMLNHTWNVSEKTQLNSNLAYQFGNSGNSRLDYGGSRLFSGNNEEQIFTGGGSNPDPAYYQKLPSYFFRFENDQDYQAAYVAQQEFLNDGQIDWPALYRANETSIKAGGNALYVLYEDRNDDKQVWINSILRSEVSPNLALNAAVRYKNLRSENFAQVLDLLGGNAFLDVDAFSEGDRAQNDLLNPNRLASEGDKIKYHYDLSAEAFDAFAQAQFYSRSIDGFIAAEVFHTAYQRVGHFQNGNFPGNSLGESETPQFQNYGLKAGLTYKISGRHLINFNAAHFTKAPSLRNTFSNARQNNQVVNDLKNEKTTAGDISYIFRSPLVKARITGFFGDFKDATEISFYYADGLSGLGRDTTTAFVQEVLTEVGKRHIGFEGGVEAQVTPTLKLKAAASIGEYVFSNNPDIYLTSDDFIDTKELGKAYIKNYRLPGGPQQAAQIGFEYRDPAYWWISATANFFADAFIDISPLSRTGNFGLEADGLPIVNYDPEVAKQLLRQEQLDSYMLINLVGGKSWRIKGKFIGVFASLNNLLDASYKTGGYEQSRNVNYNLLKEDMERKQPIFAPKYWFGPGTTYYAHLYLRF